MKLFLIFSKWPGGNQTSTSVHASAIRELKRPEELIDPISLEQIARESQLSIFFNPGEL